MVISEAKKAIFIHIPRTGGSSIEAIGDFSVIDGSSHEYAIDIKERLGETTFSDYFSFAITRNPWDRFLSLYSYFSQMTDDHQWAWHNREVLAIVKQFDSFQEFCRSFTSTPLFETKYESVCHFDPQVKYIENENNAICIDYIGRFESLEKEWRIISDRIGITARLPHLNKSSHESYIEYYDDYGKRLISDLYRSDIETFEYSFD